MATLGHQQSSPGISGKALKANPVPVARIKLSGATNTAPIDITTAGNLIHTCPDYCADEIYLWAANYGSGAVLLTLEVGGSGSFNVASKTIEVSITQKTGLITVYPGVPHENISIYAKAASNSHINLNGYVSRHYRVSTTDPELGFDGTE